MKYLLSLTLLAVASVLFVGCRSATLQTVENRAVNSNLTAVEKAIIDGCRERGWSITKAEKGEIEATLHVRSHVAVVSIPYTAQGYKIIYKSSQNLNYDKSDNSIHSNYINWVNNLDRSIAKRL